MIFGRLALVALASGIGMSAAAAPFVPGNLLVAHRRADQTDAVFEFDIYSKSNPANIANLVREIDDPEPGAYGSSGWGPSGMAIGGPDADLYVASILRGTISRFSHQDGRHLGSVRVIAPPAQMPNGLHGVAWGPNGNLFVSQCSTGQFGADAVLELDRKTLAVVRQIRPTPGMVQCLGGIGFGPDDLLYVTGIHSGNVLILDLDATRPIADRMVEAPMVRNIDMMQPGEDRVAALAALTFAPDGTLYVSIGQGGKLKNPRIGIVAPGANAPSGEIPVGQPTGIRFGGAGHIFVGDRATRAVLEIDPATRNVVRRISNGRDGDAALDPRFVIFNPIPFQ